MLQARQLQVQRDDRILFSGLDFDLAPGTLLQVAGPNGAGKTTLLNAVAGLVAPDQGRLLWQGEDVAQDPAAYRACFSFLGHLAGLKASLSPLENLRFLLQLRGLARPERELWLALDKVGLYGLEELPLERLSAGQKRRAGLARLFVEAAPLWILDEPFTAIDRQGVQELEGWLGEHLQAGGLVLLTTHHEFAPDFPLRRLDVQAFCPEPSP